MQIQFLGHSAFKVTVTKKVSILFDPFITGQGDMLTDDLLDGVTYIALTHGHADHFGDTIEIAQKTGATIIASYEIMEYCASKGLEKFEPMNLGGTITLADGVKISMVKAEHSSSLSEDGKPPIDLGPAAGLILHGENIPKSLYHMGDTDIFGDMALINELYGPDIGIVPIGDRFTMGGETAALACQKFFNFDSVIPWPYGTCPIIDQPADTFPAAMQGARTAVNALKKNEVTEY